MNFVLVACLRRAYKNEELTEAATSMSSSNQTETGGFQMAVSNNRHGLRIVQEGDATFDCIELLIAAPGGKRVQIVEADVIRPRINMALHQYFAVCHDPAGVAGFGVVLPVRWKGTERGIAGDFTSHSCCPDVVLPRGTIARWMAEAA
jgi:hypothetical protein